MKICFCLRTLNEHRNIERFCTSNLWVDKILIADGGSMDDTVSLAENFANVEVRPFHEMVEGQNGIKRNPEGKHWNFLLDWADKEKADWVLLDDCDSVPTQFLKERIRTYIEIAELNHIPGIGLRRIYLWGENEWFKDWNQQGHVIWAWNAHTNHVRLDERDPWGIITYDYPKQADITKLEFPNALLHYACPDPETADKKYHFYKDSGKMGVVHHPLESFGIRVPISDWMHP